MIGEQDHRSVSSMCKFARCPRRYFWAKHMGLESVSPVRDLAMTFGSAIHAGVPWTYSGQLDKAFAEFEKVWADGDSYEDKKRTTRTGKAILLDLAALHSGSEFPFEVLEPEIKSFVEKGETWPHEITFEVDVALPSGKPITGRIDALMRHKTSGELWLMEYKTSSQLWRTFSELFTTSVQVETYVMALRVAGYDVVGGFVEGILVAKGKTEQLPVPVVVSEEEVEGVLEWWRWKDDELVQLEDSLNVNGKDSTDPLNWPCERSACSPYAQFGLQGFVCEYEPLCTARERWKGLVGMFEQKASSPAEGAAE